jgi:TRAP-type C4-dicarboxylate transport system substrate-binding protein
MRPTKGNALALLGFLLGIAIVSPAWAQTAPVKLTANITKAQSDFAAQALQMFAERVAQYSNKQVTVEVHVGGSLGYKAVDGLRILDSRLVDISETVGAFDGAYIPDVMITTLPFFLTSFDDFALFDRMFREHLNKQYAKKNAKCLASYTNTLQHYFNKKAINKLDDLAGVKMRSYDKVTSDMLVAVGAAPVRVDFTELYTALQEGTVTGTVTSIASVLSARLNEVVSYANLTGFGLGGVNCIAINTKAWESLSPAHKLALLTAGQEVEDFLRYRVPELEKQGLEELKAKGMTVNVVPSDVIAQMRKLTEPIRTEFMKTKASPELVTIVEKYERLRGLK